MIKAHWESCKNTVFHKHVEDGIEDSHWQCKICQDWLREVLSSSENRKIIAERMANKNESINNC